MASVQEGVNILKRNALTKEINRVNRETICWIEIRVSRNIPRRLFKFLTDSSKVLKQFMKIVWMPFNDSSMICLMSWNRFNIFFNCLWMVVVNPWISHNFSCSLFEYLTIFLAIFFWYQRIFLAIFLNISQFF